jgi:hypothetical protein
MRGRRAPEKGRVRSANGCTTREMVEVESSDLVVDSGTDKGSPSAGTEAAAGRRAARPALWDLERPGRGSTSGVTWRSRCRRRAKRRRASQAARPSLAAPRRRRRRRRRRRHCLRQPPPPPPRAHARRRAHRRPAAPLRQRRRRRDRARQRPACHRPRAACARTAACAAPAGPTSRHRLSEGASCRRSRWSVASARPAHGWAVPRSCPRSSAAAVAPWKAI